MSKQTVCRHSSIIGFIAASILASLANQWLADKLQRDDNLKLFCHKFFSCQSKAQSSDWREISKFYLLACQSTTHSQQTSSYHQTRQQQQSANWGLIVVLASCSSRMRSSSPFITALQQQTRAQSCQKCLASARVLLATRRTVNSLIHSIVLWHKVNFVTLLYFQLM